MAKRFSLWRAEKRHSCASRVMHILQCTRGCFLSAASAGCGGWYEVAVLLAIVVVVVDVPVVKVGKEEKSVFFHLSFSTRRSAF